MTKKILLSLLLSLLTATSFATSFSPIQDHPQAPPLFRGGINIPLTPVLRDDLSIALERLSRDGHDEESIRDELGRMIMDAQMDARDFSPDMLKGCVTKMTCTGSGKDRTCESWSVCISS